MEDTAACGNSEFKKYYKYCKMLTAAIDSLGPQTVETP